VPKCPAADQPSIRRFLAPLAAALAVAFPLAVDSGTNAPPSARPPAPALRPNQPGFFHLAYCGTGRKDDPESNLQAFDWQKAAEGFDLSIIQSTYNLYRDYIESTIRRQPGHRFAYYLHSHAIYSYDDEAGVLNLIERNYVHATDPASLRVVPVAGGLLVDWDADERMRYDEYETISLMRDFEVHGYSVYRSEGDEPFVPIWPRPGGVPPSDSEGPRFDGADSITAMAATDTTYTPEVAAITEFVDRDVTPGKSYRYVVRTVGALSREYPFSGEVAAVAGGTPIVPAAHDHQCVVEGAPGDSVYTGKFRIRLPELRGRARLLIDRNADYQFTGADEVVPMKPSGEDWVEAIISLSPKSHSDLDTKVKFGYGYRIEVEGDGGTKIVLPPVGSYTTSVNNRVRDARWGFYMMRTDTPFWMDFIQRQIDFTGARQTGHVKCLFLDELLYDPKIGLDALPDDFPAERAVADAATMVKAIHEHRPDLTIYYNGLAAGAGPDYPGNPADTLAAAGAAGGMIEGFAVATWYDSAKGKRAPSITPAAEWTSQMRIARTEVARGSKLLLLARGSTLADSRARVFALASYLLVRAPGVEFGYMVDRCTTPPLPEWGADLGESEEPIAVVAAASKGTVGRAYGRKFEHGEVWVNADEQRSEKVKLGGPGYRLMIDADASSPGKVRWEWVDRLELGPQSAAIVVQPADSGGRTANGD
jgi:hypothetical protein